jgi:hypothetical protein
VDLYIHSPIRLHGVVLNSLSPRTTLRYSLLVSSYGFPGFAVTRNELAFFMWVNRVDLEKSRCKSRFLWPTPYTYSHVGRKRHAGVFEEKRDV